VLFKGRLRLPSDPGEGIPIDLELEDVILSLVSEGEDFGEWRLDNVEIKRLFSNQFALLLDGEEMVFVANDALGFAYDGLSFVEEFTGRLSKRRFFTGRKPSKRAPAPEEAASSSDTASQAPPEPERVPEFVPFFPEPSSQPAATRDAEVLSTMHPIEVAPAMPAGQVDQIVPEQIVPQPPVPESAIGEADLTAGGVELRGPEVSQPAAAAQIDPVETVDQVEPAAEEEDVEEEDVELVIEDVAAYGYVPPVATRSVEVNSSGSNPHPASPVEAIVENVESPAARALEIHPLDEEEGTGVTSAPHVEPPSARSSVVEPPHGEGATELDDDGPTLKVHVDDFDEEPAAAAASPTSARDDAPPAPPARDIQDFAQWSSNGQVADTEVSESAAPNGAEASGTDANLQTQKSGRHARSEGRSRTGSLFGRRKSREPEEHDHRYESSKTVGGITRSVCSVCDHVSFAGEDVYQGW
jgi:hypothetical protein